MDLSRAREVDKTEVYLHRAIVNIASKFLPILQ